MWKCLKKIKWSKILFWFVFGSLLFSFAYAIGNLLRAPGHLGEGAPYQKLKSDYALVVFQCALGMIVIFLPSILEHKFKIEISESMHIVFFIFLYGAIYLGEVRDFYYQVPNWDAIQHTLSGGMLGALGFSVVDFLNKNVSMRLSPLFIAFFAFCFSVTLGTLWEIYEFSADGILGLNMQKFMTENGTILVGRAALKDTMKDLIVDCGGAFCVCLMGCLSRIRIQNKTTSQVQQGNFEGNPAKDPKVDCEIMENLQSIGGKRK